MTGSHPARIRALEALLVDNFTVRLGEAVEKSKVALSEARFDAIRLVADDADIWQPITRSQYESMIGDAFETIEACVLDTLARSGLGVDGVDAVVQTGGSAQTPLIQELLSRLFGASKVVRTDAFKGVAAGLALRAAQLDGRATAKGPRDHTLAA
jgi:hypothetical chaperone protein